MPTQMQCGLGCGLEIPMLAQNTSLRVLDVPEHVWTQAELGPQPVGRRSLGPPCWENSCYG